ERRAIAQHALVDVLDEALRLLHPVMPFVTEEIWHALPRRAASPDYLIQASYPAQRDLSPAEEIEEARYERLIEIVRALRSLRAELNVPAAREIEVHAVDHATAWQEIEAHLPAIRRLARVAAVTRISAGARPRGAAVVVAGGAELYVPLAGLIDVS